MSSYTDVKDLIIDKITANGRGEITGPILQDVLLKMLETSSQVEEITSSDLKTLRDEAKLTPSSLYRITDYETTVADKLFTKSVGHPFDIVVLALSESELSEQAWAIQSARDTDGYFANSDLTAWQIWYCLDNDTERFSWADADNGKGVIYRMIDEWNNDVPYDFKNIVYVDPIGFTYNQWGSNYVFARNTVLDKTIDEVQYYGYTSNINPSAWSSKDCWLTDETPTTSSLMYKDDGTVIGYGGSIVSVNDESKEYHTFGGATSSDFSIIHVESVSVAHRCVANVIGTYINDDGQQSLNNIRFSPGAERNTFGANCRNNIFDVNCIDNSFGEGCHDNSLGENCANNSFSADCYDNSFGNGCYSNKFEDGCGNNSFATGCQRNSFEGNCQNNVLGASCSNNIFEQSCRYNKLIANCSDNSFGQDCHNNIFGVNCHYNDFEAACSDNEFATDCTNNSFGVNCSDNIFGTSCKNNSFGAKCNSNDFGASCWSNILEAECGNNSFGTGCNYNSFGQNCTYNSLSEDCWSNSFGANCTYNSLGTFCSDNNFGTSCSENTFGNYYRYNTVEEGVSASVENGQTASSEQQVQYYHLTKGLTGQTIIEVERNRPYETTVALKSTGEIVEFCMADIAAKVEEVTITVNE